MLVALSSITHSRVVAHQVDRTHPCQCPECGESVIYKSGTIVIPHFAHYAKTHCALSEGESIRHLQMKTQVARRFDGVIVEFELPVIEGHRADVVLMDLSIVVECQASPISIQEWVRRTLDYNAKGFAVMWVWDVCRLYGTKLIIGFPDQERDALQPKPEYRVPAEIRHCAALSGRDVFALDINGTLKACHLSEVETRFNEWYDEDGEYRESEYTPKTLRCISHEPVFGPPRHDTHVVSPYRLVRFRSQDERDWERLRTA